MRLYLNIMEELLNAVENEKNNRFQKQWVKLDKGSKLNRIKLFIESEKEKNNLNEEQTKKLKKLLNHLCENNSLNKSGDIDYSSETFHIVSIKNLKYNEESKLYSFDLPKKTIKPTTKSKSNIERHFSRSKGNKNK
tara:strand:- start:914 stop:1321 length:408 start_codon:yes stop_codon:yes gene_type:complete